VNGTDPVFTKLMLAWKIWKRTHTEFREYLTDGVVADSGLQTDMFYTQGVVSHSVNNAKCNFLSPDLNNFPSSFNISKKIVIESNFAILQPFE
jgi:hypothetical protein